MKVCITSQGPDLKSPVDPRFGRAAFFIVVDVDTGEFQAVDNKQNLQAAQGAGVQAAQNAAGLGCRAVITGNCGPKAYMTLQNAGIGVYTGADGTVEDALEAYKQDKLEKATGPNARAHWQ